MSSNNYIVIAENLKKVYSNGKEEVEVFKNLNLNIPKKSFYGIVGPSGSGKSTLLNLIGGIDVPTEGEIYVENIKISKLSEEERAIFRRNNVSYVFQFYHLIPELNLIENVALPLIIKNVKRKVAFERAKELLASLGISRLEKRYPKEISGGEQQRACIARALISEPKLMLLDEPTGNLDQKNSIILIELLKNLHLKSEITFVIATHNEILKNMCDYTFKLGV